MSTGASYEHNADHSPLPFVSDVSILGVRIANLSTQEAIALIARQLGEQRSATCPIFIVNAHTLNLASESRDYQHVLNSAYRVFADGTGARWAARMRGVRLKANLVGTDLLPQLFHSTARRGYRLFLLGADPVTVGLAADRCQRVFPGWDVAGYHHGYIREERETARVVEQINAAQPNLLLVGMGNPSQEQWIHAHRNRLRVPVSIGVGGLFDHWGGNLKRAPSWVRHHGFEWAQLLLQQPHKWRRYLIGNPKFLFRVARSACGERARSVQP
jgi:N-acetylglucosaminyldiphosphoundecaprenol N-acetyl-beta-D-mannosaminyltransferase